MKKMKKMYLEIVVCDGNGIEEVNVVDYLNIEKSLEKRKNEELKNLKRSIEEDDELFEGWDEWIGLEKKDGNFVLNLNEEDCVMYFDLDGKLYNDWKIKLGNVDDMEEVYNDYNLVKKLMDSFEF